MLHEMQVLTARPGKAGEALRLVDSAAWTEACPGRQLLGAWSSEIGELNQVVVLSALDPAIDVAALGMRATAALAGFKALLISANTQILNPREPFRPNTRAALYELRRYRFNPGGADTFFPLLAAAMPARERHSRIVGWWRPVTGETEQVVHLWGYDSFEARLRHRADATGEPEWAEFLSKVLPLLRDMRSSILLPAPFSPLR